MSDSIASQHQRLYVEPLDCYAPDLNRTDKCGCTLKPKEPANPCRDSIDETAAIAHAGLDRIASYAPLCFAFVRTAVCAYNDHRAGNYANLFESACLDRYAQRENV